MSLLPTHWKRYWSIIFVQIFPKREQVIVVHYILFALLCSHIAKITLARAPENATWKMQKWIKGTLPNLFGRNLHRFRIIHLKHSVMHSSRSECTWNNIAGTQLLNEFWSRLFPFCAMNPHEFSMSTMCIYNMSRSALSRSMARGEYMWSRGTEFSIFNDSTINKCHYE